MPSVPGPVPPTPPSNNSINWQAIVKIAGAILAMVSYGYKDAAASHPDTVAALGSWTDWAAVFSVCGVVGASLYGHSSSMQLKAACHSAAAAPPMDPDGEFSAEYTCATAYRQAILAGEHEFAGAINTALQAKGGAA